MFIPMPALIILAFLLLMGWILLGVMYYFAEWFARHARETLDMYEQSIHAHLTTLRELQEMYAGVMKGNTE